MGARGGQGTAPGVGGGGSPSPFDGDLAKQVEAMANARLRARGENPSPRGPAPADRDWGMQRGGRPEAFAPASANQRQGGRAPAQPSPPAQRRGEGSVDDDEPGGFGLEAASAGSFEEAPGRIFEQEASPGGCATGECGPDGAEQIPPAAGQATGGISGAPLSDDPTLGLHERWRRALEGLKASGNSMVYNVLAEGRLAWLRRGEVALGYASSNAFHRASLETGEFRGAAEAFLSEWFSTPTRLRVQDASEDAPASVADENREQRAQREKRLEQEAREHPAVLAALSVLGGEIEDIRVLEEG